MREVSTYVMTKRKNRKLTPLHIDSAPRRGRNGAASWDVLSPDDTVEQHIAGLDQLIYFARQHDVLAEGEQS